MGHALAVIPKLYEDYSGVYGYRRLTFSPARNVCAGSSSIEYSLVTLGRPDFLYVDGPMLYGDTIIEMPSTLGPDCTILFDGRKQSFDVAVAKRSDAWYSHHDGARGILTRREGLIEAYIERKAKE